MSLKSTAVSFGAGALLFVLFAGSFSGSAFGADLNGQNIGCLTGTWEAEGRSTKASSFGLQFDGRGRVWISLSPTAAYVPANLKFPITRDLELDASSGKFFFSIPDAGRFYLLETLNDDALILRADNSLLAAGSRLPPQINDTKFNRTSVTMRCNGNGGADGQLPASDSDDYSAVQALDGFGAVFIALGEPVLFPIERAKTCKAESGSDAQASGCAFIGFVVSPFLVIRDAFVGLGDIVTGGYFKLSRKSGVFRYFDK